MIHSHLQQNVTSVCDHRRRMCVRCLPPHPPGRLILLQSDVYTRPVWWVGWSGVVVLYRWCGYTTRRVGSPACRSTTGLAVVMMVSLTAARRCYDIVYNTNLYYCIGVFGIFFKFKFKFIFFFNTTHYIIIITGFRWIRGTRIITIQQYTC